MAFVRVAGLHDIPVGKGALVGPLAEGWLEGDAVVCPWPGGGEGVDLP
jgi:hypothetical protein